MLQQLAITNFQSHKSYTLEFDPHLTVIVGKSDVGKSALLRALRWVCFNRPQGNSFIRHGADYARVELKVDGKTIIRHKGKKGNYYKFNGKTFKALGADIPEAVTNHLNIGSANFQTQFDPHYWLSDSSGQVSKQLNKILNLSLIDSVLDDIARQLRQAKTTHEVAKARCDTAKAKLESLNFVPDMERDFQRIDERTKQIDILNTEINQLYEKIQTITDLESLKEKSVDLCDWAEKRIEKIDELIAKHNELDDECKWLSKTLDAVKRLTRQSKEARERADKAEEAFHKDLHGSACPICGSKL